LASQADVTGEWIKGTVKAVNKTNWQEERVLISFDGWAEKYAVYLYWHENGRAHLTLVHTVIGHCAPPRVK
jgi:hypothetical protein